jgi:RND family efflux transporter MFP subunit
VDLANLVELDWLVKIMRPLRISNKIHRSLPTITSLLATGFALSITIGCNSRSQPAAAAPVEAPMPTPASPRATPTTDPNAFTTTGPIVADQQADIAAERAGRIASINVQIGDRVKAGQLLASLDDRLLRSQVESQKAHIASAQAQVHEWESEEETAKSDLRRATQMRDEKIVSEETYEHAKYRVDETIAEVNRYHSEEAVAQADLNSANLQLEQSHILAPFSGVVGRSSVRPSQEVKAGDVLFWITAEAPLRVLFTVPESSMAAFKTGKPLDLTTADYPGQHQAAHILRVSPVVDPASGSVQVIGAVDRPAAWLKPGMSMQIRLAP